MTCPELYLISSAVLLHCSTSVTLAQATHRHLDMASSSTSNAGEALSCVCHTGREHLEAVLEMYSIQLSSFDVYAEVPTPLIECLDSYW